MKWKGRDIGEMSVEQIRQQLSEGRISRMHQVVTEDGLMTVDDLLKRIDHSHEMERQHGQLQRRIERRPSVPEDTGDVHSSDHPSQPGHGRQLPVLPPRIPVPPAPLDYSETSPRPYGTHPTDSSGLADDQSIAADRHPFVSFFASFSFSNKAGLWILAAGVLPFFVSFVVGHGKPEVRWIIWLLQGYFSVLLAGYFFALSGASTALLKKGGWFFLFTVAVGTPLLFAAQQWPMVNSILAQTESKNLGGGLLGYILGVGIFEELCKVLPLLFFCLGRGRLGSRDAVYLGMMSGLGFAFSEGGLYTFVQAAHAVARGIATTIETIAHSSTDKQFVAELTKIEPDLLRLHLLGVNEHLVRMISLPILHGSWTGCASWFIARATKDRPWSNIMTGILIMAFTHGIYDLIGAGHLGSGIGKDLLLLLVVGFSILMFGSVLLGREANPLLKERATN